MLDLNDGWLFVAALFVCGAPHCCGVPQSTAHSQWDRLQLRCSSGPFYSVKTPHVGPPKQRLRLSLLLLPGAFECLCCVVVLYVCLLARELLVASIFLSPSLAVWLEEEQKGRGD